MPEPLPGTGIAGPAAPGLTALYKKWNASPYNPFTRTGWNGPYIDMKLKDMDGDTEIDSDEIDILYDEWGKEYQYSKTTAVVSSYGPNGILGGGDDIEKDITSS